jgi:hypothetical protein
LIGPDLNNISDLTLKRRVREIGIALIGFSLFILLAAFVIDSVSAKGHPVSVKTLANKIHSDFTLGY